MNQEQIARVAYEVNRAYSQALGDASQQTWEDAPQWQRDSAMRGVKLHTENPNASASAIYEILVAQKVADGWVYGPKKKIDLKQHPCMVPFDDLPEAWRAKDYIFRGVVHALAHSPATAATDAELIAARKRCDIAMITTTHPRMLTLREVAAALGLRNEKSVKALVNEGHLRGINIGATPGRATWRVESDELERFILCRSTQEIARRPRRRSPSRGVTQFV